MLLNSWGCKHAVAIRTMPALIYCLWVYGCTTFLFWYRAWHNMNNGQMGRALLAWIVKQVGRFCWVRDIMPEGKSARVARNDANIGLDNVHGL